jgi:hypothetical protein
LLVYPKMFAKIFAKFFVFRIFSKQFSRKCENHFRENTIVKFSFQPYSGPIALWPPSFAKVPSDEHLPVQPVYSVSMIYTYILYLLAFIAVRSRSYGK